MKILHLEDDGPLREILAVALRATAPNCEIHQFINSDEALKYATENAQTVDLFILDVRVPGSMNGLQFAEKLRALDCKGNIVITSAYRSPDDATLRHLDCEWYPKPWHIFETTTKLLAMGQRKANATTTSPTPARESVPVAPRSVSTIPPAKPAAPAEKTPPPQQASSTDTTEPAESVPVEKADPLQKAIAINTTDPTAPIAPAEKTDSLAKAVPEQPEKPAESAPTEKADPPTPPAQTAVKPPESLPDGKTG